jgi:sugar O-acyltransferase (sialic acid O-acetyltransferase NeuD family)
MNDCPVIVVGAGGHGAVVADALLCAGRRVLGFVDADPAWRGRTLLGLPVLGNDADLAAHDRTAIELANGLGGIGDGRGLRRRVQERLEADGWRFASVCHPSAVISAHARLAPGAQVLAGAVVQALADVGRGAIVNTRAVVEHHARVGDFAHLAPGALLCGQVTAGADSHIGAGAVIRQNVALGAHVVVAMGAAVLRDVSEGTVAGVPAQALGKRP